jgi:hypothetical protein
MEMEILGRIRGFAFNPAKEFAAAKKDTLMDAFKYYVLLLVVLGVILGVLFAIAAAVVGSMPGLPDIGGLLFLLGSGTFVGIIVIGFFAALYIIVWLHIWVYLFGGRKGLKETAKAVTYGATPCLLLGWIPVANVIIGPIWSVLVVISGVMELQELSPGMAILAIIVAILVPVIIIGVILAAIAGPMMP